MRPLTTLVRESERINIRAARLSQALVIACVSRVAGTAAPDRPGLVGRVARRQLDLVTTVVGDPDDLVDSLYVHAQRLIALHQEFAHRVFDAMGADDRPAASREAATNVIPLLARRTLGR